MVLDLFCGGGGVSEGVRRLGCVPLGVDSSPQPDFVARFGGESQSFTLTDALDRQRLRRHGLLEEATEAPAAEEAGAAAGGARERGRGALR